jgi:hypothetical protein
MQLHILLLVSAAAAAVAMPLLPKSDDAILSTLDDDLLSKRGDDKWPCSDKRKYDPKCLCDLGNPLNWFWCPKMPSCKSCGM